jgi:uncharacterized protein YmfQ (DUF2313 family)
MGVPSYTAEDFRDGRVALLPPGRAWPRDLDAPIVRFLAALARGDQRLAARAAQLLVDAFPGTTLELLPEWEESLGLPDPCAGAAPTIEQRRAQVVARLISTGGQSIPYFVAVAAALGFAITITEPGPFRAGISRAGDSDFGDAWPNVWQVNSPLDTVTFFRAGHGAAGEPLAVWGNAVLECELKRLSPAHTLLLFAYS